MKGLGRALGMISLVIGLLLLSQAAPAFADTVLNIGTSYDLNTLDLTGGTTYDIGQLQFTFTGLVQNNYSYDYNTFTQTFGTQWSASDFTLTPVANGFTLTFDGGPQSITAPSNGYAVDEAVLSFDFNDLGGNLTGASVSGGTLSTSGPSDNSQAGYQGSVDSNPAGSFVEGQEQSYTSGGTTTFTNTQDFLYGSPFPSGSGGVTPFLLGAAYGDTASWDGTPTTFTFDTVSTVPEPGSLALLGVGLLGIAGLIRRRRAV